MSEWRDGEIDKHRADWVAAGRPFPIEVSRSGYDDDVVSWEVLWHASLWDGRSGFDAPIAEFDTWREAQDWAANEATTATLYRIGRDAIVGPMPEPWDARWSS